MTHEELTRDRDALTTASVAIARAANSVDDLDAIRSAQVHVANVSESLQRLALDIRARRAAQIDSLESDRAALRSALDEFRGAAAYEDRRAALYAIGDLIGTRVFLESAARLCDGLLRKANEQGAFAFSDFDRLVKDVARGDNIPLADLEAPAFQTEAARQRLKELTQP